MHALSGTISGTILSAAAGMRVGWQPGQPLPKRLPLFRKGLNPTAKGTFRVTDATLASIEAYQREIGRERVSLDFQHNTCEDTPEYQASTEPRPVAGRGNIKVVGDAIVLDNIAWTSLGDKYAEHYEDISPVVIHRDDGEVVGIHSVALVRCGATYGLSLLSSNEPQKETVMTQAEIEAIVQQAVEAALAPYAERISALETGAPADPDANPETVKAVADKVEKLEQVVKAVEVKAEKIDQVEAEVKAVEEEVKAAKDGKAPPATPAPTALSALAAKIASLERNDMAREKDHLIRCAMIDGKNVALLKPETVTALSVDDLKSQLEALRPGEVPLERRTVLASNHNKDTKREPTEQQRQVAARLGVDPAKVDWHA